MCLAGFEINGSVAACKLFAFQKSQHRIQRTRHTNNERLSNGLGSGPLKMIFDVEPNSVAILKS